MLGVFAAVWALLLGAMVAGWVLGVRALPWVHRQMMAMKKPWACDYCMCFWGTLLWGAAGWYWFRQDLGDHGWFVLGPAYPVALGVLSKLSEPSGEPPIILLDSEED
jgi:hypothetical protein